jgi:hypothetical protein
MYRVMQARSGWYYAQKRNHWDQWRMVGPFFRTKMGVRDYVYRCQPQDRVIEYL